MSNKAAGKGNDPGITGWMGGGKLGGETCSLRKAADGDMVGLKAGINPGLNHCRHLLQRR